MEDFFWLIVIIFFVVAPVIEKVLKGGSRPPQQQPRRRPPQQRLPQRPAPRAPTREAGIPPAPARRTEERADASDMLPAELWEVLTGQRPVPRPRPPEPADDEEADDDEREATWAPPPVRVEVPDEVTAAGQVQRRRDQEQLAARRTDREPPVVVSLETEPQPARQRHAAFHARIDRSATTAAPSPAPVPTAAEAIAPLLQRADLDEIRRAILMQEILGPPRGLD